MAAQLWSKTKKTNSERALKLRLLGRENDDGAIEKTVDEVFYRNLCPHFSAILKICRMKSYPTLFCPFTHSLSSNCQDNLTHLISALKIILSANHCHRTNLPPTMFFLSSFFFQKRFEADLKIGFHNLSAIELKN